MQSEEVQNLSNSITSFEYNISHGAPQDYPHVILRSI